MEQPLRILVMAAQVQAEMWKRNGFSLYNQLHNYTTPLCRTEMHDRDVLTLQVRLNGCGVIAQSHQLSSDLCKSAKVVKTIQFFSKHFLAQNAAAMMTAEDFLIRLAHKYGLYQFWKYGYMTNSEATVELSKHSVAVAEEFLSMIITIIGIFMKSAI